MGVQTEAIREMVLEETFNDLVEDRNPDESLAEALLFQAESDMEFGAEALHQLVQLAKEEGLPVDPLSIRKYALILIKLKEVKKEAEALVAKHVN